MLAGNIQRQTFSDTGTNLAYKQLEEWQKLHQGREVLNISDYCDSKDCRFIVVYYR